MKKNHPGLLLAIRHPLRSLAVALHARRERRLAELELEDPRAARIARDEYRRKLELQAKSGFMFWRAG